MIPFARLKNIKMDKKALSNVLVLELDDRTVTLGSFAGSHRFEAFNLIKHLSENPVIFLSLDNADFGGTLAQARPQSAQLPASIGTRMVYVICLRCEC
jgi:hypothetical protein